MTVLAAGAALMLLLAPAAYATAAHPRSGLTRAARDCAAHGFLTHRYSRTTLRAAIRTPPADVVAYTPCLTRLEYALRHGGDGRAPGRGGTRALLRDCAANRRLDRRWTLNTVRRASAGGRSCRY
ncbi:hypothetical protein [Candidatus Solirubrobacter pratensis]|uniref:hypothetical protein n=1 Tax=Candidatus Solirubrobacter pratensis TaxID=1298857 RepID=UPI0012DE71EB|nr:hypothetical protein [Candidatus Solirubrobacter pratensis]